MVKEFSKKRWETVCEDMSFRRSTGIGVFGFFQAEVQALGCFV
jgi:hypothetical protein